jgi:hypothetical protein
MVLKDRLSQSEFVRNKLTEYTDIYDLCLAEENLESSIMEEEKHRIYKLIDNLLLTVRNID